MAGRVLITGLSLALGTTNLWLLADLTLALYVGYRGRDNFRTHPLVLALAGIILASSLWSPDPLAAVFAALRIVVLYSLVATLRPGWRHWSAVGPVLAAQTVLMAVQLSDNPRPPGISWTASSAGQAGMVFALTPVAPIAAVQLGISGARSAAMGLALFTFLRWRSPAAWAIAALAACVFLGVALFNDSRMTAESRISPGGVSAGIIDRIAVNIGVRQPTTHEQELLLIHCGEPKERVWRWNGFGYHGYCLETGQQKPHNLWVLSWWELGLFAVPFWAIVFYGAWRLRNPYVLPLLAVGMITEEMFSRPEGFYLVALALAAFPRRRAIDSPDLAVEGPGDGAEPRQSESSPRRQTI